MFKTIINKISNFFKEPEPIKYEFLVGKYHPTPKSIAMGKWEPQEKPHFIVTGKGLKEGEE